MRSILSDPDVDFFWAKDLMFRNPKIALSFGLLVTMELAVIGYALCVCEISSTPEAILASVAIYSFYIWSASLFRSNSHDQLQATKEVYLRVRP